MWKLHSRINAKMMSITVVTMAALIPRFVYRCSIGLDSAVFYVPANTV